jgi:uncharacterized repeat protein (TIGR03803 family)
MFDTHFSLKHIVRALTFFSAALGLLLITTLLVQAQTLTTLYSFIGGEDGAYPSAGLTMDAQGNLYGTTARGGGWSCQDGSLYGCGTVFKVTLSGQETVLYRFTGPPDGNGPYADLIMDAQGNLYGTTWAGGVTSYCSNENALGCGTVFQVSPSGLETLLYSFTGGEDGAYPSAGLTMDAQGNLYGTTYAGGGTHWCGSYAYIPGCGTVFELIPTRQEVVLYRFPRQGTGSAPESRLIMDAKGNLYGTTSYGGRNCIVGGRRNRSGCGTVFKITQKGKERTLYKFKGNDGFNPRGGLTMDVQGNFYGTAGGVFELTSQGVETVVYWFSGGNDGGSPIGDLVMDSQGNLYGTTFFGGSTGCGAGGCGVLFKVTPSGSETVLYTFCSAQNCTDGSHPRAGLAVDDQGNFYGTTQSGGAYGYGTVFKLTP